MKLYFFSIFVSINGLIPPVPPISPNSFLNTRQSTLFLIIREFLYHLVAENINQFDRLSQSQEKIRRYHMNELIEVEIIHHFNIINMKLENCFDVEQLTNKDCGLIPNLHSYINNIIGWKKHYKCIYISNVRLRCIPIQALIFHKSPMIYLNNTGITDTDVGKLYKLKQVIFLNLANNNIRSFPMLQYLPNLIYIELSGNPMVVEGSIKIRRKTRYIGVRGIRGGSKLARKLEESNTVVVAGNEDDSLDESTTSDHSGNSGNSSSNSNSSNSNSNSNSGNSGNSSSSSNSSSSNSSSSNHSISSSSNSTSSNSNSNSSSNNHSSSSSSNSNNYANSSSSTSNNYANRKDYPNPNTSSIIETPIEELVRRRMKLLILLWTLRWAVNRLEEWKIKQLSPGARFRMRVWRKIRQVFSRRRRMIKEEEMITGKALVYLMIMNQEERCVLDRKGLIRIVIELEELIGKRGLKDKERQEILERSILILLLSK